MPSLHATHVALVDKSDAPRDRSTNTRLVSRQKEAASSSQGKYAAVPLCSTMANNIAIRLQVRQWWHSDYYYRRRRGRYWPGADETRNSK